MQTGKRAWQCELSTVDSTILLAGALTAGAYFRADTTDETEIRALVDALYRRADWTWAQNGGATVTHGWKPESGFLEWRWQGYDEALVLYVLGLGSPTHPLRAESYAAWASTYKWTSSYGYDYLYAGSLFTHQISHLWIDFRGIQDAFMRAHGSDYFENTRRATYVQQRYAIDNPLSFVGYGKDCWGITASDGPGPDAIAVKGIERRFFGYLARGVPDGPDDGTIAPWAVAASLPFAPEIVLPAIDYLVDQVDLKMGKPLRLQGVVQSDLSGQVRQSLRLGIAVGPSATPSRSVETPTGRKVPQPPGQRYQRAGGSKMTSPRQG
jgi:hypothetical protein